MTDDKFHVKACLVIMCIDTNMAGAIKVVIKENKLPFVQVNKNDSIDELVEGFFSQVTRLSPRWANLKFKKFHISKEDDTVILFYSAILSSYDNMYDGFAWSENVDNVDCYGLHPRSVIYV